jgi:hypothetical protein
MNPRVDKILKAIRDLPMTDVRELFQNIKYAEEWITEDADGNRTGASQAVSGHLRCLKEDMSPVVLTKKGPRWDIEVLDKHIGSASELRAAQGMAESELELIGYHFPWRKN